MDVLKASGFNLDDPKVKHVHFEGADVGPDGLPYGNFVGLILSRSDIDSLTIVVHIFQ